MQWDFGQPGRGEAAADMLLRYAEWAPADERFNQAEQADLLRRLQTRGQVGNDLSTTEQDRLNEFLRSDDGRMFVQALNDQQVERKWQAVGEPLSEIGWLQNLNRTHPGEAAEIVAVTSKLYNQNQARGALLVDTLHQSTGMTPDSVRDWVGNQGINGLNPAARAAITSGRDATARESASSMRWNWGRGKAVKNGELRSERLTIQPWHADSTANLACSFSMQCSVTRQTALASLRGWMPKPLELHWQFLEEMNLLELKFLR
ncbi:hypothetical protein MUG10_06210 [Xanthomonas prunicola]|uniref:hypothetical protein n=1 Tax=Xanthomonas prunicola TaxID=2053930 RepID=UPI002078FA53|nr:hypothetical protein [Xanthomonas prunicola]USJ01765.1 hypothetical protein MUG10_06210 [Xanthomonas prunicola]